MRVLVTENAVSTDLQTPYRIERLHLKDPYWSRGGLKMKLVWKHRKSSRYQVSWWSHSCESNAQEQPKLTVTTKVPDVLLDEFGTRFKCSCFRVRIMICTTCASTADIRSPFAKCHTNQWSPSKTRRWPSRRPPVKFWRRRTRGSSASSSFIEDDNFTILLLNNLNKLFYLYCSVDFIHKMSWLDDNVLSNVACGGRKFTMI